jgi:hypothetical protein
VNAGWARQRTWTILEASRRREAEACDVESTDIAGRYMDSEQTNKRESVRRRSSGPHMS